MSFALTHHFREFVARAADGKRYKIYVSGAVVADSLLNRAARKRLPLQMVTLDGDSVQFISKGRFRIENASQLELTSDDPQAPDLTWG